jgi:hypothetical protein
MPKEDYRNSFVEVRAIRNLLKGFSDDKAKNENIGIIVCHGYPGILNYRPAHYIAYFKYRHGDKSIVVHYHLFPLREKYGGENLPDSDRQFDSLLEKFASGPSSAFFDGAKQLEMPLPKGLKNDALLSKPYKMETIKGPIDYMPFYYWGFKLKNRELVEYLIHYPYELSIKMRDKILDPIDLRLLYHEAPVEWVREFEKAFPEWNHDFPEFNERIKRFGIERK